MNSYKITNKTYYIITEDLSKSQQSLIKCCGELEEGQTISTIIDFCKLIEDKKILIFTDYELFLIELNNYNLYE
jgi:hypothetical protein